nr:2,3-bisphosphoglycerate-dependent phosphoglycerate mutase [Modestobacter marinus]
MLLLRHGESEWNDRDLFTGWVDVGLTAHGADQARHAGRLIAEAGLPPGVLHTSLLARAVHTGTLAMAAAGRPEAPVHRSWRLNERHYGVLQGMDRQVARARYGGERLRHWRRSYEGRPPAVEPGGPGDPAGDPRYAHVPPTLLPRAESLRDVQARLLPHWDEEVVPDLRAGRTVLVTGHSNSLRALVAHLDRLSDDEVLDLDIPIGSPLHHELDEDLSPVQRGGRYLDPVAAAAGAAEVARQRGARTTSPTGPTRSRAPAG